MFTILSGWDRFLECFSCEPRIGLYMCSVLRLGFPASRHYGFRLSGFTCSRFCGSVLPALTTHGRNPAGPGSGFTAFPLYGFTAFRIYSFTFFLFLICFRIVFCLPRGGDFHGAIRCAKNWLFWKPNSIDDADVQAIGVLISVSPSLLVTKLS